MSKIFFKSIFCLFCHCDGDFEGNQTQFSDVTSIEIYCEMIKDTFGIKIEYTSPEISYTICDACIRRLRDAAQFKLQVLLCEEKLEKYYQNEQSCNVRLENAQIKKETESSYNDDCLKDEYFHVTTEIDTYKQEEVDLELENPLKTIRQEDDLTQHTEMFIEESEPKGNINPNETISKNTKGETQNGHRKKYEVPLEIHVETDRFVRYFCKDCGEKCDTQKSLTFHIANKHRYRCNICNKDYIKKSSYETHMKFHPNEKTFECNYCVEKFCSIKLQRAHMKLHKIAVKHL